MARSGLMATTTSFAHLLGLGAASGKGKALEEDDPDKKAPREDAKSEDDDDEKAKGKAKADDKPDDQGEDESDEDYEERKRREQEEKDDDDDEKDSKRKAARQRERARCSAIFASPAAGVRPDLAAHFAFSTSMSRADAVEALAVAGRGYTPPSAKRSGLGERMERQPNPELGRDPGPGAEPKPHQRLLAAHAKATGQKA